MLAGFPFDNGALASPGRGRMSPSSFILRSRGVTLTDGEGDNQDGANLTVVPSWAYRPRSP